MMQLKLDCLIICKHLYYRLLCIYKYKYHCIIDNWCMVQCACQFKTN